MIVLDTNVLSELMRETPAPAVVGWLGGHAAADLFTTSLSEAEIFFGLALLPKGKRRLELERAGRGLFDDFQGRVLPFESAAARAYAEIGSARRRQGRPIATLDAQIAAIARVHQATLATRNAGDFEHCGVTVIDPWKA